MKTRVLITINEGGGIQSILSDKPLDVDVVVLDYYAAEFIDDKDDPMLFDIPQHRPDLVGYLQNPDDLSFPAVGYKVSDVDNFGEHTEEIYNMIVKRKAA